MFENVKKAIFGRTKPEEAGVAPQAEGVDGAEGDLRSSDALPAEELSGGVKVGGVEVEGEGGESAREASSEETNSDFQRADVEGSEQDDVAVEAVDESVAATEEPTEDVITEQVTAVDTSTGELDKAKTEAAENYDKYLRAVAELENYKKRALRERADVLRYAGESLARDMLEIADHLQRALAQDMDGVRDDFVKGLQLILDRFQAIMEQHQVRGESAVGTAFDPVKHEALASVPTADHPAGTVLEEFKRAYYFKDKLLRPAQVVVAKDDDPPAE